MFQLSRIILMQPSASHEPRKAHPTVLNDMYVRVPTSGNQNIYRVVLSGCGHTSVGGEVMSRTRQNDVRSAEQQPWHDHALAQTTITDLCEPRLLVVSIFCFSGHCTNTHICSESFVLFLANRHAQTSPLINQKEISSASDTVRTTGPPSLVLALFTVRWERTRYTNICAPHKKHQLRYTRQFRLLSDRKSYDHRVAR